MNRQAYSYFKRACPTREDKHKALCTLETCMEQMKGMTNGEDAELYFIDAKSRYFSVAAAFLAASKKVLFHLCSRNHHGHLLHAHRRICRCSRT